MKMQIAHLREALRRTQQRLQTEFKLRNHPIGNNLIDGAYMIIKTIDLIDNTSGRNINLSLKKTSIKKQWKITPQPARNH